MIKKIIQFFLYSSADPTKISLTLKAGLPLLALLGFGTYTADATTLVESLANLIVVSGQFVAGAMTTYGIVRKIYLTITDHYEIR